MDLEPGQRVVFEVPVNQPDKEDPPIRREGIIKQVFDQWMDVEVEVKYRQYKIFNVKKEWVK